MTPSAPSETSARARGERRAPGRQRLIWRLLADALRSVTARGSQSLVLDCGGGSGSFAVPLAQAGARVTVVDASVDALATLHRRAAEAGVADRVHPVQGDLEALDEVTVAAAYDLALAHDVLGAVDDAGLALGHVARAVHDRGLVSIVLANPAAGVLSRALAGEVSAALDELRLLVAGGDPGLPNVVTHLELSQLAPFCAGAGLSIEQVHGVGVFSELVPGAEIDARPGALTALAELDELAATRSPYRDIAARLHVLARRSPTAHGGKA